MSKLTAPVHSVRRAFSLLWELARHTHISRMSMVLPGVVALAGVLLEIGRVHGLRLIAVFHGALDTVATTQQMRELAQQISAAGGPCDLVVFEDDTHSLARHRPEVRLRSERFHAQLAMH